MDRVSGLRRWGSVWFADRMSVSDVDRLLLSLSRCGGLSESEVAGLVGDRWSVGASFLPVRLRVDH